MPKSNIFISNRENLICTYENCNLKKSFILDVSITSYLPNPQLGTLLDSFFKKISCNAALFSFISNQLRLRFSENMFSWN